jgi:O-antigen ligase
MNKMRTYREKANYFALLLLAFSLDFPQIILNYTLALWFITSFFSLDLKQNLSFRNTSFIPLLLILTLTLGRIVLSFVHGDYFSLFSKVFDTQLSLTFLPLLLIFYTNRYFNLRQVLKVYVLGAIVSCVVMVVYFYLYRFNILKESGGFIFPKEMINHSFSDDVNLFQAFCSLYFKHRAGIGANLALSIACLFFLIRRINGLKIWKKIVIAFSLVLIIIVLYATGSRSGYISLFVILIYSIIYLFSSNRKLLLLAFVGVMALLLGLTSLKTTRPLFFNEVGANNYEKLRKTDPRFRIWESVLEIIAQNPCIGVGYSRIQPDLIEKYKQKKMVVDLKEKHSSHNQFFQFALESGIWASLILTLILLPIYYNKKSLYLSLAFSATFTVYSLFEDTLILINGVSIFVFFMTILILSQRKRMKQHI